MYGLASAPRTDVQFTSALHVGAGPLDLSPAQSHVSDPQCSLALSHDWITASLLCLDLKASSLQPHLAFVAACLSETGREVQAFCGPAVWKCRPSFRKDVWSLKIVHPSLLVMHILTGRLQRTVICCHLNPKPPEKTQFKQQLW